MLTSILVHQSHKVLYIEIYREAIKHRVPKIVPTIVYLYNVVIDYSFWFLTRLKIAFGILVTSGSLSPGLLTCRNSHAHRYNYYQRLSKTTLKKNNKRNNFMVVLSRYRYWPSIGMTSGIGGIVSPTISRKTTRARRIVISRLTLSPDSTGRKKPRKDTTKMRKHGAIRLTT